jgi:hypothetical protein
MQEPANDSEPGKSKGFANKIITSHLVSRREHTSSFQCSYFLQGETHVATTEGTIWKGFGNILFSIKFCRRGPLIEKTQLTAISQVSS